MRHTILHADVMDGLASMPDESIQCVMTSPPYWGLRDYGIEGQIGLEPTPEAYVERLVEVFREVRRVLRDDGTLWLNLGDSYNGSGGAGGDYAPGGLKAGQPKYPGRRISALKPKDLVGMPWRIAFALQAEGWYLRSDIIWHKPNPMPESVRDRPTKSHEHVFLLAKRKRYFYDADAVREVAAYPNDDRGARSDSRRSVPGANCINPGYGKTSTHRNRRDVWRIPTRPYKGAHFATFPPALVEPCLLAGTSERGACPVCGAPWRRVVERLPTTGRNENKTPAAAHAAVRCSRAGESHAETVGWEPSCGCETQDGEPVPCIVLDPFTGSGTVNLVAHDLGRSSVGIELNEEYIDIIKNRWARGGRPAEALEVRAI
ncbi:MAG: site-specific DNA-methyltransferase [Thermobispora sp.]|nr:site-specific DNA-methyltransferase [Thermobispora sp.]